MELSYPPGTTRRVPKEQFLRKPNNKSFIDQACSFKMVWYWPRSFFCEFMDLDSDTHIKRTANIQPSWPHTWSITHMGCHGIKWNGPTKPGPMESRSGVPTLRHRPFTKRKSVSPCGVSPNSYDNKQGKQVKTTTPRVTPSQKEFIVELQRSKRAFPGELENYLFTICSLQQLRQSDSIVYIVKIMKFITCLTAWFQLTKTSQLLLK